MDTESSAWIAALNDIGAARREALARLHELLVKAAFREAYRRAPAARISGPELEDIAHQAADDAMVSLLRKLDTFRGESRFTTWAFRFVMLEVASKFARHYWRAPQVSLSGEEWDRLPERFGEDPLAQTQHRDLIAATRRAVEHVLTETQREVFVAVVVNGVPMDALAERTGKKLNALYKMIFDARRKIRDHLTANGYLDGKTERTAGNADEGEGT